MILLDDHLVRDLAAGEFPSGLEANEDDLATTNLWLFRLAGALARQDVSGSLSSRVKSLGSDEIERFRRDLAERFASLAVVPMSEIVWRMADLQERHRQEGRMLSVAMAEALAAARVLEAAIAVAETDVGPGLRAASEADGIEFLIVRQTP